MSSFDPTLFKRLLEIVLSSLKPVNQFEVKVFETYSRMLAETETLIIGKKIIFDEQLFMVHIIMCFIVSNNLK